MSDTVKVCSCGCDENGAYSCRSEEHSPVPVNPGSPRTPELTWDEYFMAIARLSAKRSKDPNTQVGACIVGDGNRILSIGYNGAPNGYDDDDFPWSRGGDDIDELDTKYLYVVHAEENAILNYRGNRRELEGATLYVDLFPCNECAKTIAQSGIREVVYLSDKYAEGTSSKAAKKLFAACGVKVRRLGEKSRKTIPLDLLPQEDAGGWMMPTTSTTK